MPDLDFFPKFNASLNGLATLLLLGGFAAIRSGRRNLHRACMVSALATSAVFLASYLTYHYLKAGMHTRFTGEGLVRVLYYGMLLSHVVLAMAMLPLIFATFRHAFLGNFERHKAWARWTFPIWLYVSITGVLVYFCLYVWWPG